jgi:hypothetical protein
VGLIELGMNVATLHTGVRLGGHFKYYSSIYHKGIAIATRHTTFQQRTIFGFTFKLFIYKSI